MVSNSFLLELGIRSIKWDGKNIQDVMIFLLGNVLRVDCMIEFELESVAEEAPHDIKKLFMI